MSTASPTTVSQTIQWDVMFGVVGTFIGIICFATFSSLYHRGHAHIQLAKKQDMDIKHAAKKIYKDYSNNVITEEQLLLRTKMLREYSDKITKQSSGEGNLSSKITNEIAEGMVAPMENNSTITGVDYGLFHTGIGRFTTQFLVSDLMLIQQFLVFAMGGVFSYWSNFLITNTCSSNMNACYGSLFAVLAIMMVLVSLLASQTKAVVDHKMADTGVGTTFVSYTADDKALQAEREQNENFYMTSNN